MAAIIMNEEEECVPQALSTIPETLQDLPELLARTEGFSVVLSALRQGRSATVDGAWGSSAALATASLTPHAPRTLLVVIAHPRDIDGWTGDLTSFTGLSPLVFPAWDDFRASGDMRGTALSMRSPASVFACSNNSKAPIRRV